ncbi:MAG: winged helix-turn-helix domain-containing protein [Candidatus Nanohaloarchaea archaeon]
MNQQLEDIKNSKMAFKILRQLYKEGELGPTEIADKVNSSPASVVNYLSILENLGAVNRLDKEGRKQPYQIVDGILLYFWKQLWKNRAEQNEYSFFIKEEMNCNPEKYFTDIPKEAEDFISTFIEEAIKDDLTVWKKPTLEWVFIHEFRNGLQWQVGEQLVYDKKENKKKYWILEDWLKELFKTVYLTDSFTRYDYGAEPGSHCIWAAMNTLERTENLKAESDSIEIHPVVEAVMDKDEVEEIKKEIKENRSEGHIDEEELNKIIDKYDLDDEKKEAVKKGIKS